MTRKITLLLATVACGLAAFTAPALANYLVEEGPKIENKEGKFELVNEGKKVLGTFKCEKETGKDKQKGKVSEVEEEETDAGCKGTIGKEAVTMKLTENIPLKISRGKELEKEAWTVRERIGPIVARYTTAVINCQVTFPRAQFQGTWRNLGGGQSRFTGQAQVLGTVNSGAANEFECLRLGISRKVAVRRRVVATYRRIMHL